MKKRLPLPKKGTAEWHKLQVAKHVMMSNSVMNKVLGGMTEEEAEETLKKYGL